MEDKIKELYANPVFVERLKGAKDLTEIADIFCNEGVDVSADDLVKAQTLLNENGGELNEEMLENVAGGSVVWGCIIIWTAISYGIGAIHGFSKGGR